MIIDIFELISPIFDTVFYLLFMFFVPIFVFHFFFCSCVFNRAFYMISFSLLSYSTKERERERECNAALDTMDFVKLSSKEGQNIKQHCTLSLSLSL